MARSENQGLQIALILFVLLTVALAIATFGFFQSADKAQKMATQATADASKEKLDHAKTITELQQLKVIVGVPVGDSMQVIQETANVDTKLYNDTFASNRENYRDALIELMGVLVTANQERQQERTELDAMKLRIDAIEKAKDAALTSLRDELAKAKTDLTAREKALADTDATHTATRTQLGAEIDAKNQMLAQIRKETDDQLKDLNNRIVQMKADFDTKSKLLQQATARNFDGADGEIQWVSPRAGTVWINVGRADGLAKQVTFSVWGRDENDFVDAEPKGKIEVTQMLDEHLAEAKIIDDSLSEPIMPGDRIASSAWDPGRKQTFAVAGVVDFNGDRKDDMETLRSLIALNGGEIVAEMDAEGNIVGPGIDIHTRYLVMGESPAEGAAAAVENYSKLVKMADDKGVEVIDVNKFLTAMGWKDPNRVLTFGAGGNAQDFRDPNANTRRRSTGTTSELFRKRRPTSNGNSSF